MKSIKSLLVILLWPCMATVCQDTAYQYDEQRISQVLANSLGGIPTSNNPTQASVQFRNPSWSTEFSVPGIIGDIYCSATDGSNLYLGGKFNIANDKIANGIARWDGNQWHSIGTGIENGVGGDIPGVQSIAIAQGKIFIGGQFQTAGSHRVDGLACWDGQQWSSLGTEEGSRLKKIIIIEEDTTFTFGAIHKLLYSNNRIYVAGDFQMVGDEYCNGVAAWNLSTNQWETLGIGLGNAEGSGPVSVYTIAALGNDIYVGGYFLMAGGLPAEYLAKWNGQTWSAAGNPNNVVESLHTDPQGRLIASGPFNQIGPLILDQGIAILENNSWTAAFQSDEYIVQLKKMIFLNNEIIGIGSFEHQEHGFYSTLAQWNGSEWIPNFDLRYASNELVSGFVSTVEEVQGRILLSGSFTMARELITNNVIEWIPSADSWVNLASSLPNKGIYDGNVLAFAEYNDDLLMGGTFSVAGGTLTRGLARWDGDQWHAVGENYEK